MNNCFICAYFIAAAQPLLYIPLFSLFSSSAAEKVSSLGKDWHKFCLKCERCNKTLNPGGHAEVQGLWGFGEPCVSGFYVEKPHNMRTPPLWEVIMATMSDHNDSTTWQKTSELKLLTPVSAKQMFNQENIPFWLFFELNGC